MAIRISAFTTARKYLRILSLSRRIVDTRSSRSSSSWARRSIVNHRTTDNSGPDHHKIIRRVFDAEEVYSGPHTADGPDLLVIPHNGYDLKGKLGSDTIVGDRRLQGMHTWDNAFFFSLRNDLIDPSETVEITDDQLVFEFRVETPRSKGERS